MAAASANGRLAFGMATAAVACSAAFTVWALTASAYSSGETILEANPEFAVRVVVALPLLVTAGAWVLLHLACRRNLRWAKATGTAIASLLVAFGLVTGFSIGLFVMPAALLLLLAAVLTPVTTRP